MSETIFKIVIGAAGLVLQLAKGRGEKKKEEERIAEEKKRASEEKKIVDEMASRQYKKSLEFCDSFISFIDEISISDLYIDSNVFMDDKYVQVIEIIEDSLFRNKSVIKISKIQFDEIINIKDNAEKSNNERAMARRALRLIENLLDKGLLDLEKLEINSEKGAYFDKFLIEKFGKNGANSVLITNDIELRIKIKQKIKENGVNSKVIEASELLRNCKIFFSNKTYIEKYDLGDIGKINTKFDFERQVLEHINSAE